MYGIDSGNGYVYGEDPEVEQTEKQEQDQNDSASPSKGN